MMIIPGDRDDLLLATCMAAMSGTQVAAVLLTGGLKPDPRVWKLCGPGLDTGSAGTDHRLQHPAIGAVSALYESGSPA